MSKPDIDSPRECELPPVPRRVWAMLAGITLLGAGLRMYGLARWSLWYDEGYTMYVLSLVPTPSHLLDTSYQTEPLLLPTLLYGWLRLLNALGVDMAPGPWRTDFLIRFVPGAFSAAAVPLGFAVARRFARSDRAALIASFLLACSPFHIFYAQELRPYATMTVFMLTALWFLGKALESDRTRHWTGFVLALALAMYNHLFTVWYIASLGLAVCLISLRRGISVKWVVSQVVLFLLILPALQHGFAAFDVMDVMKPSWYPPIGPSAGIITLKTLFAGYGPRLWAYGPLLLLGIGFSAYGAWALRRRGALLVVALVVCTVPIVGNLVIWGMRHEFEHYYEHRLFIICGFMYFVLMGAGIAGLRTAGQRAAALVLWAAFTAPGILDTYAQHIHPSVDYRLGLRHKPGNREASNAIRADLRSTDAIGHFTHATYYPMNFHYLRGRAQVTLGFTGEDRKNALASYPHESMWEHTGALPVRIDTVAAQHDRLWYIDSWWEPFNPPPWNPMYRGWLSRHGVCQSDTQYFGLRLGLYDFAAMQGMRVEQAADAGTFATFRYLDAFGRAAGSPPVMSLDDRYEFVLTRDPASGQIAVRNGSAATRSVQGRYYESVEAVEPLSFNRASPEADAWHPVIHGDPAFHDNLDLVKMAAALERGKTERGVLYADVALPDGAYTAYAYVWTETGPANSSRATLRFDVANVTDIVTIVPWSVHGESGWGWRRLATVRPDGTAQRLSITASLPEGMDKAYADIGRVVFMPADAGPPRPIDLDAIHAGAGTTAPIAVPASSTGAGRRDVFVEDTASGEVRFVNWYTAPGIP